jgi:hypothetical protein
LHRPGDGNADAPGDRSASLRGRISFRPSATLVFGHFE